MLVLSSTVAACLIHLSSTVSALSVPPTPSNHHDSAAPHMSVDDKGVRWSHNILPPPGACVTKGACAHLKPLTHLSMADLGSIKSSRVAAAAVDLDTIQGYVVTVYNGIPFGYLQSGLTGFGTFTYTGDVNQAQFFTRPSTILPSPNVFEIETTTEPWAFLGACEGFSAWPPGNPDPAPVYASFTPTSEGVAPATNFDNPCGQPTETNLWTLNLDTGELTVRWGLDSGEYVPMELFFDITYGDLNMARNLTDYTGYFGDIIAAIQFYFYVPPS